MRYCYNYLDCSFVSLVWLWLCITKWWKGRTTSWKSSQTIKAVGMHQNTQGRTVILLLNLHVSYKVRHVVFYSSVFFSSFANQEELYPCMLQIIPHMHAKMGNSNQTYLMGAWAETKLSCLMSQLKVHLLAFGGAFNHISLLCYHIFKHDWRAM